MRNEMPSLFLVEFCLEHTLGLDVHAMNFAPQYTLVVSDKHRDVRAREQCTDSPLVNLACSNSAHESGCQVRGCKDDAPQQFGEERSNKRVRQ